LISWNRISINLFPAVITLTVHHTNFASAERAFPSFLLFLEPFLSTYLLNALQFINKADIVVLQMSIAQINKVVTWEYFTLETEHYFVFA